MDLYSELAGLRQSETALVLFRPSFLLFIVIDRAHTHCVMLLTKQLAAFVCGP